MSQTVKNLASSNDQFNLVGNLHVQDFTQGQLEANFTSMGLLLCVTPSHFYRDNQISRIQLS